MSENVCRGCGATVARGRTWCPPYVRDCLAQYRASADYRAETMARDGHACARCGWWNRVVLADVATGRLRLLFALLQLLRVPRARKANRRGGWRTRVVDVDHIDPIGATGTHSAWNLQVLCVRHHKAKTVRDVARMKGHRPPMDRARVARWALLVVLVAVVGFQLLTPELRTAVRLDPVNGLGLVFERATQLRVLVPLGLLVALVAAAEGLRRINARVVRQLAEALSVETNASASMKRSVRVRRWGRVPGFRLPRPVDVVVRYPHTFRDDDPAKVAAVEGRLRARLGWTSCRVQVETARTRMRFRFPDPFLASPPTAFPLLGAPSHDLWDGVDVATDEDGRPVTVGLIERNLLVGGEPGAGKSNVLSMLLAAAALDRDCSLWLLDGKQVEFTLWGPVAERHVATPQLGPAIAMLRDLVEIIDARYALMAAEATEESVTRKVSRGDGFGLIFLAIDELASYTAGGEKRQDRETFVALLRDVIQRGRAAGVICVLATQRPSADVVPTSIRDVVGLRWALRCATPASSDMVLGQGTAAAGFTSSRVPVEARGTGLLLAEGTSPRMVRAHYVNDADLVRLARQARVLRGVQAATAAAGTSLD